MRSALRAIEMSGMVDSDRHLHLDGDLPITGPSRVRVIVLVQDEDDIDERRWLHAATHNEAFDFLNDPAEDIYTLSDGIPFRDQA